MSEISFNQLKRKLRLQTFKEIAEEYEKIIKFGIDSYWTDITKNVNSEDDLDCIYDDEIEMIRLFEYRMKLMIICCLSQTWEQDLCNYLIDKELLMYGNEYKYDDVRKKYNFTFKKNGIDKYQKISEMRLYTNAIKHGNGLSFNKIIEKNRDTVLIDAFKYIDEFGEEKSIKKRKYDSNVLTSMTLNVEGKIKEFYDEIIKFWENHHLLYKD